MLKRINMRNNPFFMFKIYKNTIKNHLMLVSHKQNQSYKTYVICGFYPVHYAFLYD